MPDDHSKSVPPLPIPNRTVKRFYADDSAATSVKVGYRQASYLRNPAEMWGFFSSVAFSPVSHAQSVHIAEGSLRRLPRTRFKA
jgi:hypothetical protein